MKILSKIAFLLLLATIFCTCRSESELQCTNANTVRIIPHALDFFYFKTGSWWVYEEETTGERDSIWVGIDISETSNATKAKTECNCGRGKCVENKSISFFSRKANGQSLYGFRISSGLIEGNFEIGESGKIYDNPTGYRIMYINNQYLKESPGYGVFEDLSSIEVRGKTYNNILHLYYTNQTNIPDWLHEAWYARNIYLVKFRLWDETTWNLVDYHIVK